MHPKEPIKDDAAPSVSPILAGSKGAKAASSPFRYALPADNKANEIALVSLSRCHNDVATSVSKYSSAEAREVEDASCATAMTMTRATADSAERSRR